MNIVRGSHAKIGQMVNTSTLFNLPNMAMGQNPVPPVNIRIPTKIGPKMGGEFTQSPKWDPKTSSGEFFFAGLFVREFLFWGHYFDCFWG